MSDSLKALMDRVALLEAQTFSTKSTLPPLVENPEGLPPMIFPGGAMDFSYFAFGFSIAGAVVTFQPGEIHHGTRAVITVGTVNKTITADLQYVWIEYTFGGSAVFAGPSTTMPVSTETVMKVWLACFNWVAGTPPASDIVTVNLVGHIGNIEIPGAFG
jgi:hypothetical protein